MINIIYSATSSKVWSTYGEEKQGQEKSTCFNLLFPPHQPCELDAIYLMFFSLFCPPPEGAHKQLSDIEVETGTEKLVRF